MCVAFYTVPLTAQLYHTSTINLSSKYSKVDSEDNKSKYWEEKQNEGKILNLIEIKFSYKAKHRDKYDKG